jgi:mannose/fructose/N-acetylgalactosamine-specific phosphotransferase system component IIC
MAQGFALLVMFVIFVLFAYTDFVIGALALIFFIGLIQAFPVVFLLGVSSIGIVVAVIYLDRKPKGRLERDSSPPCLKQPGHIVCSACMDFQSKSRTSS